MTMICATGQVVAGAQDGGDPVHRSTASDGKFMRLDAVRDMKLVTCVVDDGKEKFEKLGTIHDLIVNEVTGDIDKLVISSGGVLGIADTLRAISVREVNFNSKEERFEAKLNEAAFEAIVEFDAKAFRETQLSARKRIVDAGAPTRDKSEAGDKARKAEIEALRGGAKRVQCLAHDVAGWPIHVMREAAGDANSIYVDVAGSKIAFIEFDCEAGEDQEKMTLVVPFLSFEIQPPTEEGETKCSLQLNLPKSSLAEAPSLGENKDRVLQDRVFRDEVRAYYSKKSTGVQRQ